MASADVADFAEGQDRKINKNILDNEGTDFLMR